MAGIAMLAALAWHQVREKPHLSDAVDESMMTGTLLEESTETAQTPPVEESLEQARADACENGESEPELSPDCPHEDDQAAGAARQKREDDT